MFKRRPRENKIKVAVQCQMGESQVGDIVMRHLFTIKWFGGLWVVLVGTALLVLATVFLNWTWVTVVFSIMFVAYSIWYIRSLVICKRVWKMVTTMEQPIQEEDIKKVI